MRNLFELTARQPHQGQRIYTQQQLRPVQLLQPEQLLMTQLTPVFHHQQHHHLINVNPVFLNNYGLQVRIQSLQNGSFKFHDYNVNIEYLNKKYSEKNLQDFFQLFKIKFVHAYLFFLN